MGEDAILHKVLAGLHQTPDMILGPGDDCAVLQFGTRWLLAAADQVVSEVHYRADDTAPEEIAAKVLKRNLSDIAAMGGVPRWALLTLAATPREEEWLERFFAGLEETARRYQVAVAGGDLGSIPGRERREYASLTILGEVEPERLCRRDAARPGEVLMVTGELGNSFSSRHHLTFEPRLEEARFLADGRTKCMMDLSDGLGQDLRRLGRASQVAFALDGAALPCRAGADVRGAMCDGEDYELVFTVAPERVNALLREWPFATRLSKVGQVTEGVPGSWTLDWRGGKVTEKEIHGYEHFQA